MDEGILSLEEAFGPLQDPRSRTPLHSLTELLMVALCAVLSGADSWLGIQYWGEAKLPWLRQYLPLANGIASHDTFGRVFAALDSRQFEACFIHWVSRLCPALMEWTPPLLRYGYAKVRVSSVSAKESIMKIATIGLDLAKNVFVRPEGRVSFCFTGGGLA